VVSKRGFLDEIECNILRGWAIDDASMEPARVDIALDGTVIATISCSEFRADLARAQVGDGHHGFCYPLPAGHADRRGLLTVGFAGGGPLLTNGERDYQPDLAHSLMLSSVLARGAWHIRDLTFTQDSVLIQGWAVPPGAIPVPLALTHNGNDIADVTWLPNAEIGRIPRLSQGLSQGLSHGLSHGLSRDQTVFGFSARRPLSLGATNHEFHFVHGSTKRPFDRNQGIHYFVSGRPLAPEALRVRVSGTRDPVSFVRLGSSAFARLQQAVENYFSTVITAFDRILDWGCGCGATLRYFPADAAKAKLTGADIDSMAIDWCSGAFPSYEFLTINTHPPTPLPDETFDLIYGISVMSHLREADHLLWLEELRRLARPNGIVLLSTLSETAFWRGRLPWSRFGPWRLEHGGFLDAGSNPDLGQLNIDPNYYRNVFISHEYIARKWTNYFDLVDILPGAINNHQDLVILQKPKSC
jgi:SAM-dependent methyltransferase